MELTELQAIMLFSGVVSVAQDSGITFPNDDELDIKLSEIIAHSEALEEQDTTTDEQVVKELRDVMLKLHSVIVDGHG